MCVEEFKKDPENTLKKWKRQRKAKGIQVMGSTITAIDRHVDICPDALASVIYINKVIL